MSESPFELLGIAARVAGLNVQSGEETGMKSLFRIAENIAQIPNLDSMIGNEIAGIGKIVTDDKTIRIDKDEAGNIEIVEVDPQTGAESYYTLAFTITPK